MSTPVQRQYWDLKSQNPDAILFFRLGDFYELFFEDAVLCSKLLGLTLTARHKNTENEMPMAGFPHHAHKQPLEKLVELGYKVAVAEQKEDRDGKISRIIDRVITPGTTLESGNLPSDQNNFLAAILLDKGIYSLAYTDCSTGVFKTAQFENEISFFDELYRLNPKEILCDILQFQDDEFSKKLPKSLIVPKTFPTIKDATKTLNDHFPKNHLSVSGIAHLSSLIVVSSVILNYLNETQKSDLDHIQKIDHYTPGHRMSLDGQTFRHLEIFDSIDPTEKVSLYQVFEKPYTPMGSRKLREIIAYPLKNTEGINNRLKAVEECLNDRAFQQDLPSFLKNIGDIERILARLASGRGNARDLSFVRNSLAVFSPLKELVKSANSPLLNIAQSLQGFEVLHEILSHALVDHPPLEITEGGMIATGFNERLDELKQLSQDSDAWLQDFLDREKAETGIQNVRVKYSKNFGFCLEVSKAQAENAPDSWIRRQTLVNAERFTTPELETYEKKVLSAESESFALEHKIFLELRESCLNEITKLQNAARQIGVLDAIQSLSRTAKVQRWHKPNISETDTKFVIKDGRHPVVENLSTERFIPNDLRMCGERSRFHLISGPNMAGKSTFLRQNALIIWLGQMGSYVPASEASWSTFDRIFTRVGASDNLAAGKSTFFVEMTETATILHAATDKSFIILDEIGRGTSTFDGISLAWAITEFLHDKTKAKTLFATHYHELIDLAHDLSAAENFQVSVTQNKNGIVFLRQIKPGGIADSFGIEVAKLSGIPTEVIKNAKEVLARLESENLLSGKPNLFAQVPREPVVEKVSEVENFVQSVNPDELSPKEALEKWYELKKIDKK